MTCPLASENDAVRVGDALKSVKTEDMPSSSGKLEKYLTRLAGLFPAYSKNKPVKNGDHGIKPY
jgi:hypothetical protein